MTPDMKPQHPGEILKKKLAEKRWTQREFALITGKSVCAISYIATGRTGISPEMAVAFAAALGTKPEEWLHWDLQYRLAFTERDIEANVKRAARLHEVAPLYDMQKRGWIKAAKDLNEIERELQRFFSCTSLEDDICFPVAMRRTATLPDLNPAERAWCFQARRLAMTLHVAPFDKDKLRRTEKKLRRLAAYPKEARHIQKLLSDYGIRFVVVEPLPGARIDGAAFWLDESSPVIAVSLRFDRMDSFWFTVMHEFSHICNGDSLSVDTDLVDEGIVVALVENEAERLANEQASAALIPEAEIKSFIQRVGPLYSKERIVQFAVRIKIHPAIVIGQLQKREELGYSALRDMLVKIRDVVVTTALTDGWNQTIKPGIAEGES